jgi:hypothetical protein
LNGCPAAVNVNQGVKEMDNETIEIDADALAARLGAEAVAELRSLHDKAGRLALMLNDKLALPTNDVGFTTDGVSSVGLGETASLTIFAPRVLEVLHGTAMPKLELDSVNPVFALASRELERALAPAVRVDAHTVAVDFEGVLFHVEVVGEGDDFECLVEGYGAEWVCFCGFLFNRPADVATKEGV